MRLVQIGKRSSEVVQGQMMFEGFAKKYGSWSTQQDGASLKICFNCPLQEEKRDLKHSSPEGKPFHLMRRAWALPDVAFLKPVH